MFKKIIIRALWLLAEAAIGIGIVVFSEIDIWWALPIVVFCQSLGKELNNWKQRKVVSS